MWFNFYFSFTKKTWFLKKKKLILYNNLFFISPTITWIIKTFTLNIWIMVFFLHNYFSYPKIRLIYLFKLFFISLLTLSSLFRSSISNFNCFDQKKFFRQILELIFWNIFFIFWYYYLVTNFISRTFALTFYTKVNISVWLYINRLDFNGSMICIIVFVNYFSWIINVHIFWYWCLIVVNFLL